MAQGSAVPPLPETPAELGLAGDWQHMIDSTTVRTHSQAVGSKGGRIQEGFGRSRGGFTRRIHALADGQGRPLGFVLTGGKLPATKPSMT
jgi:hypothetical protein